MPRENGEPTALERFNAMEPVKGSASCKRCKGLGDVDEYDDDGEAVWSRPCYACGGEGYDESDEDYG